MGAVLDRGALQWQPGTILLRLELPPISATQLTFYCGATGVTDPIHYDLDFARRFGFPERVVNGSLRVAWIAETAAALVRAPGYLHTLSCQHRKPLYLGTAPTIEIRLRAVDASSATLDCDVEVTAHGEVVDTAELSLRL